MEPSSLSLCSVLNISYSITYVHSIIHTVEPPSLSHPRHILLFFVFVFFSSCMCRLMIFAKSCFSVIGSEGWVGDSGEGKGREEERERGGEGERREGRE